MTKPQRTLLGFSAFLLAACAAWALGAPGSLTINGNTVSTNFLVQGGVTYVPLSAVAKALGGNIQRSAGGYAIAAGGGTMVAGTTGKVGQTLTGPGIQFTVLEVVTDDHYKKQFGDGVVDATGPDATVVAIKVRIRNTTKKVVGLDPTGTGMTAIADTNEHSYPPYTGMAKDCPPGSSDLLPGSTYTFALTFSFPKSAQLKALVYQTDGFPKQTTFRVSLAPPAPPNPTPPSS